MNPLIKSVSRNGLRKMFKYNRINLVKLPKRTQSTAHNQIENNNTLENFHKDVAQAFTYTPADGYIRNSPLEPVTVPNIPLDEYVWQNLHQWEHHVAAVSIFEIIKEKNVTKFASISTHFNHEKLFIHLNLNKNKLFL